ncbi:MAG: hypothetical protein AAF614_27320 [Chloroflexota bacterium]
MTQLTIDVSEELAIRLHPVQAYLLEFVELGLHHKQLDNNPLYQEVVRLLQQKPSPTEILESQPSPITQKRIEDLLQKNRAGELNENEEEELDNYRHLNHFMTLVKLKARQQLS